MTVIIWSLNMQQVIHFLKMLTINFFEHAVHVLQVVVIQEPHRVIPVIFIKWY